MIGWGSPNGARTRWKPVAQEVKKIHPRQIKGKRGLLNTPYRSSGQDSRREAVCNEAVGGAVF